MFGCLDCINFSSQIYRTRHIDLWLIDALICQARFAERLVVERKPDDQYTIDDTSLPCIGSQQLECCGTADIVELFDKYIQL